MSRLKLRSAYLDNCKYRSTKIQNEKKIGSQSIKTYCIVLYLYRTLHEIESTIESAIKINTE